MVRWVVAQRTLFAALWAKGISSVASQTQRIFPAIRYAEKFLLTVRDIGTFLPSIPNISYILHSLGFSPLRLTLV